LSVGYRNQKEGMMERSSLTSIKGLMLTISFNIANQFNSLGTKCLLDKKGKVAAEKSIER
jgi:hypothetical protein